MRKEREMLQGCATSGVIKPDGTTEVLDKSYFEEPAPPQPLYREWFLRKRGCPSRVETLKGLRLFLKLVQGCGAQLISTEERAAIVCMVISGTEEQLGEVAKIADGMSILLKD